MSVAIRRKTEKLEAVNIRLSKKMKFTLDLAARINDQSQSAYVVDCLLEKLKNRSSGLMTSPAKGNKPRYIPDLVWHKLDSRRVINLGIHVPELLNSPESLMWTVVQEDKKYWLDSESPDFEKIRKNWVSIQVKALALQDEERGSA
jgi:hypothetical protein